MWYVVYKGYEVGVCGDSYTLKRRIKGYDNAVWHKYDTRKQAEDAWNRHIGKQVRYSSRTPFIARLNNCSYDNMPRYKGSITTIPEIRNSYQLITLKNTLLNYRAYIVYNHKEIYWSVHPLDNYNDIWACLNGICTIADLFKNTTIFLSDYSVACVFEKGWLSRWMQEGTYIEHRDRWAFVYKRIHQCNLNISYHPDLIHKDLVVAITEFAILRTYWKHFQAVNPLEYEKLHDYYYIQAKAPSDKNFFVRQLTSKCTY